MRKLVVLLFVLALLGAACSGGGAIVATVDGTDITLGEVEALRPDSTTVPRQEFADDLMVLILEEVLRQGSRELGVVEDQAAIDAFYADYVAGVEAEGPFDEFLDTNNITEETLRHYAYRQVLIPVIQARVIEDAGAVTEEDIRNAYDQLAAEDLNLICTRHILVTTEAESQDIVDRLAAGEDFSALAAELSLDGSGANGGDIGCISETAMVSGFVEPYTAVALTAPIGEVNEPFQSEFGFHVMVVDSRTEQTFDELRLQLEQQLSDERAGDLVNGWFETVMGAADVVIDERYGTWQTEPTFGVIPPA